MKHFPKTAFPSLLILALFNALVLFVHRVMTNGDNLDYLFIAGAVNAGHWTEPFHWRFPVGYPYFLAFLSWLGDGVIAINPLSVSMSAINGIKLVGVAMAPLAVAAVCGWARTVTASAIMAWMIALLMATTQVWAPVFSIIGAEPYFLVSVWLALWGWEKVLLAAEPQSHAHHVSSGGKVSPTQPFPPYNTVGTRYAWLAVACGASLAALMFRQLGLAIPLAVVIAVVGRAILDGKGVAWRLLAGAVAVGVAGVLLMALNTSHLDQLAGAGAEEQSLLSSKWALLCANVEAYRMTIPHLLLPKMLGDQGVLGKLGLGWLGTVVAIALGGLLVTGLWSSFRERRAGWVSALFVVINIGIILVWPYRDTRFFVPLLPGLWMLIMRGATCCRARLPVGLALRPRWAIGLVVLLAMWQQATTAFAGIKNIRAMKAFKDLPAWHPARYELTGELDFADHLTCGMWLGEHAEPDAMIFGAKSSFLGLSSGRPSYYLEELLPELSTRSAPYYVVVDNFPVTAGYGRTKLEFLSFVESNGTGDFEIVFRAPHGAVVYRRLPGPITSP